MSSEPKPFASLSPGLLARKGAAKPAMRPQVFSSMNVQDDLGWNARVRATDNDGERMLNICQFYAPVRRLTGMLQTAAGVAAITFLELRDCFRWSY